MKIGGSDWHVNPIMGSTSFCFMFYKIASHKFASHKFAQEYEVLRLNSYTVHITEGIRRGTVTKEVSGIDCTSGACDIDSVTSNLVVDLTAFANADFITLQLQNDAGYTIRSLGDQEGGSVQSYTILCHSEYTVAATISGSSATATGVDCLCGGTPEINV